MSSGGQGRRRNVGDIRAFLKWAVEEKDSPDRWFPIIIKNAIIVGWRRTKPNNQQQLLLLWRSY